MAKTASLASLLLLLLGGCSIPQIVVLHDPLSADEHVQLGIIYASQEKPDLAREQFRAATKKDKRHARAWTLLGDLSYRQGDLHEAEKAYTRALELHAESGDIRNNLAWVYIRTDRKLARAHQLVSEALSLRPDRRAYYLDTLGVVLLRRGRTKEAVITLEQAVAALPGDRPELVAEAFDHLADAYAAAGDEAGSRQARQHADDLRLAASPATFPFH